MRTRTANPTTSSGATAANAKAKAKATLAADATTATAAPLLAPAIHPTVGPFNAFRLLQDFGGRAALAKDPSTTHFRLLDPRTARDLTSEQLLALARFILLTPPDQLWWQAVDTSSSSLPSSSTTTRTKHSAALARLPLLRAIKSVIGHEYHRRATKEAREHALAAAMLRSATISLSGKAIFAGKLRLDPFSYKQRTNHKLDVFFQPLGPAPTFLHRSFSLPTKYTAKLAQAAARARAVQPHSSAAGGQGQAEMDWESPHPWALRNKYH